MTLRTILLIILGLLIARVVRRFIAARRLPAGGPPAGARRVASGPTPKQASGKAAGPPSRPRASGDERPPHDILGVSRDAGAEEIRAAYQKLAKEYHPDRAATLAPEIQELATRRMSEINRAYEALTKDRS